MNLIPEKFANVLVSRVYLLTTGGCTKNQLPPALPRPSGTVPCALRRSGSSASPTIFAHISRQLKSVSTTDVRRIAILVTRDKFQNRLTLLSMNATNAPYSNAFDVHRPVPCDECR